MKSVHKFKTLTCCARKFHIDRSLFSKSLEKNSLGITKGHDELKPEYDVVIIGGGHNGLVSAAYLALGNQQVCVLERRHVIGGAAVTEEIIPGFKFSRASYVLSLLRPFIISDLKLKDFSLKFHMREPFSSFTPIKGDRWASAPSKYLLMGSDMKSTCEEIGKFSKKDALAYPRYEEQMSKFINAINILLDNRPPPPNFGFGRKSEGKTISSWMERFKSLKTIGGAVAALGHEFPAFHETLTVSATKILDKWFESEPLKATLATDALIGNMAGPATPGSGYVLLHHLMGGVNGKAGAWAYPEGGMGAVSEAIGRSAASLGAQIFTNMEVKKILYTSSGGESKTAIGVLTSSGQEIRAKKAVFSSATPHVTFKKLFPDSKEEREEIFGSEFVRLVDQIDYVSPVTKINVAVSRLPNFLAKPNVTENGVQDLHKCTIHMNSETMEDLADSFSSVQKFNIPSENPMIEMTIPSSLDPTLAPQGAHVCLFFTQFTPIHPSNGTWSDPEFKEKYAQKVFDTVEEYSPGFKASIVGKDVLTPLDLENIFGLTGGNIFHGSMSLDQLYWLRPVLTRSSWFPKTPLKNLYLCGSGAHPGGGVMGLPGFLAAKTFINSV